MDLSILDCIKLILVPSSIKLDCEIFKHLGTTINVSGMLDFEVDIRSAEVLKNVVDALEIIEKELRSLGGVRLTKLEVDHEKVFDVVEYNKNGEKRKLIIPYTIHCFAIFEAEENLEEKYKKEKERDGLFWYKFFYLNLDDKLSKISARVSENNVKVEKNRVMIEFFVSPPSKVHEKARELSF